MVAITSGGTIPDRGLFGVFLPDGDGKGGRRVGELDEEMVYEARAGQTFLLGASTWRIEEIGRDRVIVTPAPGAPGAIPFWKGDGIGRPKELGEAIGLGDAAVLDIMLPGLSGYRVLERLRAAGVDGIDPSRGPKFDSLPLALRAAIGGAGVAIGSSISTPCCRGTQRSASMAVCATSPSPTRRVRACSCQRISLGDGS